MDTSLNYNKHFEVIFVEDNPNDAELTIRALDKHNLANSLIQLEDGEQALDFIFAQNRYKDRQTVATPSLILLDIKMPKIDGIEVLQTLRTNKTTQKIPVVILTSSRYNPDIQKCYEWGANSYIVKPVNYHHYTQTVSEIGLYWLLTNQSPFDS